MTRPEPLPPDAAGNQWTDLHRRVAALEAVVPAESRLRALEDELCALRREIRGQGSPEGGLADTSRLTAPAGTALVERVWQAAPLGPRLQFLAGLLAPGSPYLPIMTEALELLRLEQQEGELERWFTGYPSVFMDAVSALLDPTAGIPDGAAEALEELVEATLSEARYQVLNSLRRQGIEWIEPASGDAVTESHAIVSEESAPGIPPGRVVRCHRRGFRFQGQTLLPALVTRQPERPQTLPQSLVPALPSPTPTLLTPTLTPPSTAVDMGPESAPRAHPLPHPTWLRLLVQQSPETSRGPAEEITRGLATLEAQLERGGTPTAYELSRALTPLLPLLAAGGGLWRADFSPAWLEVFQQVRPAILLWLREALQVEVLAPAVGSSFCANTMQVSGERRSAHPHEWGTVARLECPGLRRGPEVLIPARVVRYKAGESF